MICAYCGEKSGSKKYCKNCSTKLGREEVFKGNVIALECLRMNGYCKDEVLLIKP